MSEYLFRAGDRVQVLETYTSLSGVILRKDDNLRIIGYMGASQALQGNVYVVRRIDSETNVEEKTRILGVPERIMEAV